MKTKRVFELAYNDVFSYFGIRRIVTRVENAFIYHKAFGVEGNGNETAFGWHSKERVEFHFNKGENKISGQNKSNKNGSVIKKTATPGV